MPIATKEAVRNHALHGFAERSSRNLEPRGQVGFAKLCAGWQRSDHDGLTQLPRDDPGRRFPADRFDIRQWHHHSPPLRNSAPSERTIRVSPASRSPSHTVTWLAVSTGLRNLSSIVLTSDSVR